MSIFSKVKKKKVIAVLNIASAAVGGMLIEQNDKSSHPQDGLKNDGPVKVISAVRKPVNFLFDVDLEASWRCSVDALRKVMTKLLKDFPKGPDAVLCVFSSPWFAPRIKTVNIRKEKSFEVKRNFFDKLVADEEENFKETHSFPKPLEKNEMEFIERENIRTEINGYPTESPIGKKARTIKIDFYFSLGIKQVIDEVKKEILKNFGDIPLLFKTFPALTFFVLNRILRIKENFLVVDIGGEMTDVYLIKNNALNKAASFPHGINFLIRNITAGLNTFINEASSILKTYLRGHKSPESSEKTDAVLKQAKEEWSLSFNKTLTEFAENAPLPQSIFLLSDKIGAKLFIDCMQNDYLAKFTILGKPLKVINVKPDWLLHYFDFASIAADASGENGFSAEQGKDIALLFESFFANEVF